MKAINSFLNKAVFFGSYYVLYTIVIFTLYTLAEMTRSQHLKVTVGMEQLLFSMFLGFLYWYCQIALGKLQEKWRVSQSSR